MFATVSVCRRSPAALIVLTSLGVLIALVCAGHGSTYAGPAVAGLVVVTVWHRSLLQWDRLVALILLVVLFVPMSRYKLSAGLFFNLELYRMVVALVVAAWIASLVVDHRIHLRRTAFDLPVLAVVGCVLASEVTNPTRVFTYSSYVAKALMFFASFILVYFLITTTITRRKSIDFLLQLLALGGAIIGFFGLVEWRTGYNVFDHLQVVMPFLTFEGALTDVFRGGHPRILGPAEQAIALGAALILVLPVTVYLAKTSSRLWWIASTFVLVGSLASGSRTAIIMLVVEILVYLALKPRETLRLWPLLLPILALVHVALPGTLGGFLRKRSSPREASSRSNRPSAPTGTQNCQAGAFVSSSRWSPKPATAPFLASASGLGLPASIRPSETHPFSMTNGWETSSTWGTSALSLGFGSFSPPPGARSVRLARVTFAVTTGYFPLWQRLLQRSRSACSHTMRWASRRSRFFSTFFSASRLLL